MKYTTLILLLAACTVAASAQTPAQPAPPSAAATKTTATATKPASTAKPAGAAAKAATSASSTAAPLIKTPDNIPVVSGPQKTLFTTALRYKEIQVGTGAVAEPGKLLKFNFTLWLADSGVKFDSTVDHPGPPLKDKDGKPVLGDDGKPKLGDPAPAPMVMGKGRPLPGWDMGVEGMKVGGKRRIYVPWQLGFGASEIPARDATHPAVPAKSDLILDVELAEMTDAPQPPQRPMPGRGPGGPMPGAHPMTGMPPTPPAPGAAPNATAPATPPAAPKPAAPPVPAPGSSVPAIPAPPAVPTPPAAPQTK
ncbi:MAG: FKBP-type peptidyl-prolyl cis-trans isomerase [Terracidiphilus sp.]